MCAPCEVPWKATVRFADVPSDPHQQALMEEQIRRAYTVPSIYEPLAAPTNPQAAKICATFAKLKLSPADLDFLNDQGRSLFEPYKPST